jgi:hypothetical protein
LKLKPETVWPGRKRLQNAWADWHDAATAARSHANAIIRNAQKVHMDDWPARDRTIRDALEGEQVALRTALGVYRRARDPQGVVVP